MTVVLPFKLKVPGKDEFQSADSPSVSYRFHGLLRLDGTDLHIEWAGTEVTATDLAALAVVPGEAQGRVRFWIARSHRQQAAALVEALHRARDAVLADGAG